MMNLNLNNSKGIFYIKHILLVSLILSICAQGFGQNKSNLSIGFSIAPSFGGAFNRGDGYDRYKDSVKSTQGLRATVGVHVWANYAILKKLDIQAGLGYMEAGFSRRQENLSFGSITYPGIGSGKIEDLSNTKKAITYQYRFKYIQVPVLFNFYVKRSGDFKWIYNFTAGITANILVKHQVQANMDPGFTIEGKNTYQLDSTGFSARPFALNLMVGGKVEYHADKRLVYFAQPLLGIYPLSVSGGDNKSNPWCVLLNVGIMYDLF